VAVVGAFLFAGLLVAVVAGALVVLLGWSILSSLGTRRSDKFRAQLPDSLQLITGSLRAGFGLNQAITAVANELPSPAGEEYARAQLEVHLGRDVEDALRSMAARVQSEDLPWVAEAIEIHREIGGDVADLLDQVASTVRERERVRGQIKVLSAEGRISGVVLVALPFGIAGITLVTSPDYLTELVQSTVGLILLAFGAVTMLIGIFWIRRIIRLEF
jgi:tight adherence protein B